MKPKLRFKSAGLIPVGLSFLLLILFGQNCSQIGFAPHDQAANSPTGGGSGEGFDGKLYVHAGVCNSLPDIDAKIWVSNDHTKAWFLRHGCVDADPSANPLNIVSDLDLQSSVAIIYKPEHVSYLQPTLPLNKIYMASPTSITATAGQPMPLNISMTAVPMGLQGYQICVHFLNSNNQALPIPNCFWPSLISDVASGDETFTIQPTLPAGTAPGTYLITVFYARWDSVQFVTVPMLMGPGVTASPQLNIEYAYTVGSLTLQ